MKEYVVTLLPGSGIGSALLGIVGGLYYLEKNKIHSILYVNQYYASTPVNCLIDYFLDKEQITCLHFINKEKTNYQELFFTKEAKSIYHDCLNSSIFENLVILFHKIFILKNEYKVEHYDICINIRRGDKITLESLPCAEIEEYIKTIQNYNLVNPTIFHTSDEYDSFLEIKKKISYYTNTYRSTRKRLFFIRVK